MTKKKDKITLTPFETASENGQQFAINMYTFYLFQKSCNELLLADKVIKRALAVTEDEIEMERLLREFDKNNLAWDMIMKLDALSGSSCYAEA